MFDFIQTNVVPVVQEIVATVISKFDQVVTWFQTVWPQVQEAVGHVVAVVQALWRTFGDEILSVARIVWAQVSSVIETAVDLVRGVIEFALALINGDWGKAWDAIKGIVSTAWEFIKDTVGNALALVGQSIELALSGIRAVWDAGWGAIKSVVQSGVAFVVDKFLAMVEFITSAAATAFGWVPGIGDDLRRAAQSVERFRDEVNASLRGIEPIVITAETSQAWAAIDAVVSHARQANALAGGQTGGAQQFARGLEVGPVRGAKGQPVPIIAHAGEWVLTPEQMADLSSGRSGGSSLPLPGVEIDYDRLAAAVAAAVAANPSRAYVVASDIARGLHTRANTYR